MQSQLAFAVLSFLTKLWAISALVHQENGNVQSPRAAKSFVNAKAQTIYAENYTFAGGDVVNFTMCQFSLSKVFTAVGCARVCL